MLPTRLIAVTTMLGTLALSACCATNKPGAGVHAGENSAASTKQPVAAEPAADEGNIQYHVLQGMQALVSGVGDERATVRFSLLISFEGNEAKQQEAIRYFNEANREKELEVQATRHMRAYAINSIENTNFDELYGESLREKLNGLGYPHKFRSVLIHSKSIQRR